MTVVSIRPCDNCETDDPSSFYDSSTPPQPNKRWLCIKCTRKEKEALDERCSTEWAIQKRERHRRKRERAILAGAPFSNKHPTYRCIADPTDCFLGSYMSHTQMTKGTNYGVYPSGSLWLNDHTDEVFEVLGQIGQHQDFLVVSPKRLRLMESRFPRLRRALCNPAVS